MEIFRAPLLVLVALALGPLAAAHADERVSLSTLDLSQARQGWGKPQADQSVAGHPLTLNKKPFAHGFGTHSRGLLVIDVNGATRLTATVGIDDEVGPGRGSAEFQVRGENHEILWSSGIMRGGQPPKNLDLDLHGQRRIILRVTDGGDGFEYDHADWADAQFRRDRSASCYSGFCRAGARHCHDGGCRPARNPSAAPGRHPSRHAAPLDNPGDRCKAADLRCPPPAERADPEPADRNADGNTSQSRRLHGFPVRPQRSGPGREEGSPCGRPGNRPDPADGLEQLRCIWQHRR